MAKRHSIPPVSSPSSTPSEPPTIREVLDSALKDARKDCQQGAQPFYGTPLTSAWSYALTRHFPLPSDVNCPNPVDNALAIAALCREVAKLKGVTLPDKYGGEG